MIKKQKYSPSLILFTLFLILIFISLGTWQLKRKKEKEALLYTLAAAWKKEIHNIDKVQTVVPLRPLSAEGHYIAGKTIFLQAKTHRGKSGVYVLDVFQTHKGQFLLVQRGWSSKERITFPIGDIKIEGIVRTPSVPTYFQPSNKAPVYFWLDLAMLSKELHVPLLPYYLVAKDSNDPQILPTDPFPLLRNNHLEYAITWYSLAFVLLVMLLWSLKNRFYKEHP